jgi:hypothetical protein
MASSHKQARRAASVEVARRVAALKAQWGFEEIEVRIHRRVMRHPFSTCCSWTHH